jgi:pyruvate/2-oxoglutarate dehydrogenase complex dihydrolipoamide dehydrogenase (E3) component
MTDGRYQLAVIGAGSGGREAALAAAHSGLRVVLIERDTLGGTCLHRGFYCLKTLRACAEAQRFNAPVDLRSEVADGTAKLPDWLATQQKISIRLTQAWGNQLGRAGVAVEFGQATLADSGRINVSSTHREPFSIEADYIILATGSRPEYDGLGPDSRIVNSDDLLKQRILPKHLLIVGGGYIGCEFATIFRALGSRVTLVEQRKRLLSDWDEAVGDFVAKAMRASGVELAFGAAFDVTRAGAGSEGESVMLSDGNQINPDLILIVTGRKPNVEDLGVEKVGISVNPFVAVDEQMRTSCSRIYAIGDLNGLSLLDSAAISQARVAVDSILGKQARFSARWIPRCIHTDPGAASIGWNEDEAGRAGLDVIAHSQTFRLVTDDERTVTNQSETMLKVLIQSESRQILGVHAVGHQAAEIVSTGSRFPCTAAE